MGDRDGKERAAVTPMEGGAERVTVNVELNEGSH